MRYLIIVLASVACIVATPAWADAYRCVTNGKTIYSDQPCGNDARRLDIMEQPQAPTSYSFSSPGSTSQAPGATANIYDTQLRNRIAAAISANDFQRAESLAVTEAHWKMIADAKRDNYQDVTARKAATARNRPVYCNGVATSYGTTTYANTICR